MKMKCVSEAQLGEKGKVQTEPSWEHKRSIEAGIECHQVLHPISCDGAWVDHIDTIQDSTKSEVREAEDEGRCR